MRRRTFSVPTANASNDSVDNNAGFSICNESTAAEARRTVITIIGAEG